MSDYLYKHFILFCIKSAQNRKKQTHVLFDIKKGGFEGKVFIPRKDICCKAGHPVHVQFGWHGDIYTLCGREGVKVYVTVYDSIESNLTGYLNLILRNGISITLRSFAFCISKGGDVYYANHLKVTVYRRQTWYQPVKHKIRHAPLFRYGQFVFGLLDIWSDTFNLISAPGPVAIAFLNLCHPVDGIVEKGSGNDMTFREVISSFHPPSKDTDYHYFLFSMDGSLLHPIRSPKMAANVKEHLVSTDIYTRMRY
jgi:hypothetical protein